MEQQGQVGASANPFSPNETIHLGWIPYLNLHPLKIELKRLYGESIKFEEGHPTDINQKLIAGRVDLAPSSSICLIKNMSHEMAFPVGVACTGAVQSVYLGLSQELTSLSDCLTDRVNCLKEIFITAKSRFGFDQMRQLCDKIWQESERLQPPKLDFFPYLRLSQASASGSMLARIFYKLLFGSEAYIEHCTGLTIIPNNHYLLDLVIGDDALVKRSYYAAVIDLGKLWFDITGLPFVFAVWQKTDKSISEWRQRIIKAAEIAEARMKVDPTYYLPDPLPLDAKGDPINLASYWKELRYMLLGQDVRGLLCFLCLAKPLLKLQTDDTLAFKMLRWQEQGDRNSRFGLI